MMVCPIVALEGLIATIFLLRPGVTAAVEEVAAVKPIRATRMKVRRFIVMRVY